MIQFSEDYNAQTIFNQVWEAPYEWFALPLKGRNTVLPALVFEMDGRDVINEVLITVKAIEDATIRHYVEVVSKQTFSNGKVRRPMADYLQDLDADDVDAILQWAMFDEIRYG